MAILKQVDYYTKKMWRNISKNRFAAGKYASTLSNLWHTNYKNMAISQTGGLQVKKNGEMHQNIFAA
jgi:hypothetical protein